MYFDLEKAIEKIPNNSSFKSVIDYIIKEYHIPSRKILPELEWEIDYLVKNFWEKFSELFQVKELFKQFEILFIKHINREEELLFPKIIELEKLLNKWEKISSQDFLNVEIEIKKQNIEHEEFEIYWASFLGLLLNSKMESESIEEYFDLVLKLEN